MSEPRRCSVCQLLTNHYLEILDRQPDETEMQSSHSILHQACIPVFQHRRGKHTEKQDPSCRLCADSFAMSELARLSDNAKGLILNRVRDPLTILMGTPCDQWTNLDLYRDLIGKTVKTINASLVELLQPEMEK